MASFLTCCTLFLFVSNMFMTLNAAFSEEMSEAISIKRMEKTTQLHFYFHDIHSGKNPTAVRIAGTSDGGSIFGDTYMIDDALTEGPQPSSRLVGRAQGLYGVAAQGLDMSLLMAVNYAFTEERYNGSSISILGRNPWMNEVREMPIVGGSGVFRLARGYALAHTVWLDAKTGDATVEYNVYVHHF